VGRHDFFVQKPGTAEEKLVRTRGRRSRLHEVADRKKPPVRERFVISGKRRAVVRKEPLQAHPQGLQRNVKRMETEMDEGEPQMRAVRQLSRSQFTGLESAEQAEVRGGELFHL
jgi:hypothetical protein